MRATLLLAAFVAAVAGPAGATTYTVQVSGMVVGTSYIIPTGSTPWSGFVQSSSFQLDLQPGSNSFSYGSIYSVGQFSGKIVNMGGVLTGQNMSYSYDSCAPGSTTSGCHSDFGTAASFLVSGGVPEPATWAMMAAGFAAAGVALRRRPIGRVAA